MTTFHLNMTMKNLTIIRTVVLITVAAGCSESPSEPESQANLSGTWEVTQSFTGASTTNPNQPPLFFGSYRWQLTHTADQVTGQVTAASGAAGDGTFSGTFTNGILTGILKLNRDPVAYRAMRMTLTTTSSGEGTAEYSGPETAYQNGAVADYYTLTFSRN